MTPILLRIPEDTLESIDHASMLKTKNRSQFIRDCIKHYLKYFQAHEEKLLIKMKSNQDDFYKSILLSK